MKKGQGQKSLASLFNMPIKAKSPGGGSMTPQKKKTPENQNSQKKTQKPDSQKPSSSQEPIFVNQEAPSTVNIHQTSKIDSLLSNSLPNVQYNESAQKPTYQAQQKPTYQAQQKPTYQAQQKPTYQAQQKPTYQAQQRPTPQPQKTKPIKKGDGLKRLRKSEKHQDDEVEVDMQQEQSQGNYKNYNDGIYEDQVEVRKDGADQSQEEQQGQDDYESQDLDDRSQSQLSLVQEEQVLDENTIKFNKKFDIPQQHLRKDVFNAQFNTEKNLKTSLKFIKDDEQNSPILTIYNFILQYYSLESTVKAKKAFDDVLKNLFPVSGKLKQADFKQMFGYTEQLIQQHGPALTPQTFTQLVRRSLYGFLLSQFINTKEEEGDQVITQVMEASLAHTSITDYLKQIRPRLPPNNPPSNPPSNPPASNPPANKPPASNPPANKPPASNPPASNPPANKPPASNPPANKPPANKDEASFTKFLQSCLFTTKEQQAIQSTFKAKYTTMRQKQPQNFYMIETHQNKISQLQNQVQVDTNMVHNELKNQFPNMDHEGRQLLKEVVRLLITNRNQVKFIKKMIQQIKQEKRKKENPLQKSNIALMMQNRLKRQAPTVNEPTSGTKKPHLNENEKPKIPQKMVDQRDKNQIRKAELQIPQWLVKISSFKFAQLAAKLLDPQEFNLKHLEIALAKNTWQPNGLLADLSVQFLTTNMKSVLKYNVIDFVGKYLFGQTRTYIDHPGLHSQARDFIKTFGKLVHQQNSTSETQKPQQTEILSLNTWYNRTEICPECAKSVGDKKEKEMKLCGICKAIFQKAAMDILSDLKQNLSINIKTKGEVTTIPFIKFNEQVTQTTDLDEKQELLHSYRKAQVILSEQTLYFKKFVGELKYTVSDIIEALMLLVAVFYGNPEEYKSYTFKLIESSANAVLYYGDKNASKKTIHNFNLFQWIFEATERGNTYSCNKWKFMPDHTERELSLKWISMNMTEHQDVYCGIIKKDTNNIKSATDEASYQKDVNKFFWKHAASNFGGRRLFVQLAELSLGFLCGALEKQTTWKFSKIEQLADPIRVTGKNTPKKALM